MSADTQQPSSTSGAPPRRPPRTGPHLRHHGNAASSQESVPGRPVTCWPEDAAGAQQPEAASSSPRQRPLRHAVRECGTMAMARTASLASLAEFPFQATMLDPATALQGLAIRDAMFHAWLAIRMALGAAGPETDPAQLATCAVEEYLASLGMAMMDSVPGPHFTFISPRGTEQEKWVRRVKRRVDAFRKHNIPYERFVIGIPASLRGIEAAREVSEWNPNVRLNMLFVSSFEHAKLCVEVLQPGAITFSCSTVSAESSQLNDAAATGDAAKYFPEPPCDWVREMETTAAWLHLKKLRTQLLVADLCGTEIPLPAGVDCVVLGDKDIEEARGYGGPFIQTSADEAVVARARGTPYQKKAVFNKQMWHKVMKDVPGMAAELSVQTGIGMMSASMQNLNKMFFSETQRCLRMQMQDTASLAAQYQTDRTALLEPATARRTTHQDEVWHHALDRQNHVGFRLLEMDWDQLIPTSRPTVPSSKALGSVLRHKRTASVSGTPEQRRVFGEAATVRSSKNLKLGRSGGLEGLSVDKFDNSTRQRSATRSSSASLLDPRQARIKALQASPEGAGGIENTSPIP